MITGNPLEHGNSKNGVFMPSPLYLCLRVALCSKRDVNITRSYVFTEIIETQVSHVISKVCRIITETGGMIPNQKII